VRSSITWTRARLLARREAPGRGCGPWCRRGLALDARQSLGPWTRRVAILAPRRTWTCCLAVSHNFNLDASSILPFTSSRFQEPFCTTCVAPPTSYSNTACPACCLDFRSHSAPPMLAAPSTPRTHQLACRAHCHHLCCAYENS
jgi:hypothetical protein